MWWGADVNGNGMPIGMFMIPVAFLILIAIMIYSLHRSNRSRGGHRFNYDDAKNEILKEIQEIQEDIRELKKEKEKE